MKAFYGYFPPDRMPVFLGARQLLTAQLFKSTFMASPYPAPTAIKELRGTTRADRCPITEPRPEARLPKAPLFLKGEALKEYNRVGKLLLVQRVMTDLDRGVLVIYASAWGEIAEAEEQIAECGKLHTGSTGYTQFNGWTNLRNAASERMLKAAMQLGLTPSARSRVSTVETKTEDNRGFTPPPSLPPRALLS